MGPGKEEEEGERRTAHGRGWEGEAEAVGGKIGKCRPTESKRRGRFEKAVDSVPGLREVEKGRTSRCPGRNGWELIGEPAEDSFVETVEGERRTSFSLIYNEQNLLYGVSSPSRKLLSTVP